MLITDELRSRPAPEDLAAENRALSALAMQLAEAPDKVQATLVEVILELCQADSAGISLLEAGPPEVFRWTAVGGEFAHYLGSAIPRDGSPCGFVIERNAVQLLRDGARYFPLLRSATPAVHECLLAPFDVEGRPGGTVWAVKHRPEGRFNAEHARVLKSLSSFAAVAYRAAQARVRAERARDTTVALHPRLLQVSKLAMIGEIASGVANELSQPLTAIHNYAQACRRLLDRPQADLDSLNAALEDISAQSRRAMETITGLRRLAAPRASEAQESDLNQAVQEVMEMVCVDARKREVRIDLRLATDLPRVRIERSEIQHVILNLVRNALEVLEGNPAHQREMRLETRTVPECGVELVLSDNGPGLPEAVRGRMFAPFYSTKTNGTGLGLPISHSIILSHGGQMIYEPTSTGGARFTIRLAASSGS